MAFDSERAFEQYIRELIRKYILPKDKQLMLFKNKKAVDILLCRNGKAPAVYFIEIKYHTSNRLGIGHGEGGGFQPEILLRQPSYFQKNMRWILGTKDKEGYFFIDNDTLRNKYISGGIIADKYNNIKRRLFFEEVTLSEKQLIKQLKDWLLIPKT